MNTPLAARPGLKYHSRLERRSTGVPVSKFNVC